MIKKILFVNYDENKDIIKHLEEEYEVASCIGIKHLKPPALFSNDLIVIKIEKSIEDLIRKIKYINELMIKNILIIIPHKWKKDFYKMSRQIEFIDVIYEPIILKEVLFQIQRINKGSDQLYYEILSQMDLMALVLNSDRRILYANNALLEETGYTIDEVIGKNIELLKSNEHSLLFYDNLRQTLDSNLQWTGTFINERKDGSIYWEDASIFKVNINHEEVYVKIALNVSRREKILSQQEKETKVASQVQRSLLPKNLITSHLKVEGFYRPLKNVSGDIYNWLKINENIYAVYLLDVVGHGVASALITTSAISIINNLLEKEIPLDILLKKLNNKMMRMYNLSDLSQNNYYTMTILIIDFDRKSIKYSNCGHPAFYMINNNELLELREGNFPIGLLAEKDFTFNEIRYESPVELLLFSDGLIEIDYDKRKGVEVLEQVLNEYIATEKSGGLLSFIRLNLLDSRIEALHDDVTMTSVSIDVKGVD
jgi:sigma-B regulation protein RsbU (phosphoserine phosphatase)